MPCFFPNGKAAEGLQPCNSTAGSVSSCCRVGDVCLSNGFCFSTGQNSVIRRGCTDQTFNSTECPQQCLTGDAASVDVVMTPCGDYTYFCCGQDAGARSCCNNGNGTVLVAAGTAILPTMTLNTTITATGMPGYTGLSTPTTTATTSINCDSLRRVSDATKYGLGAAVIVVAIIATLCGLKWYWTKSDLHETKKMLGATEESGRSRKAL